MPHLHQMQTSMPHLYMMPAAVPEAAMALMHEHARGLETHHGETFSTPMNGDAVPDYQFSFHDDKR
eukprot:15211232-Ditylum_brightwellii.AAC.1